MPWDDQPWKDMIRIEKEEVGTEKERGYGKVVDVIHD